MVQVSKAIRKFYFGDGPIDEKALVSFYEYFSDLNFVNDLDRSVKRHVAHSKGTAHYAWYGFSMSLKSFLITPITHNCIGTDCHLISYVLTLQNSKEKKRRFKKKLLSTQRVLFKV